MPEILTLIQEKRQQITAVLTEQDYSLEAFSEQWNEYHQLLAELCQQPQTPDLQNILADNLQWVSLITEQVSSEREAIATKMLQLRKGKKAHQSYGDNN